MRPKTLPCFPPPMNPPSHEFTQVFTLIKKNHIFTGLWSSVNTDKSPCALWKVLFWLYSYQHRMGSLEVDWNSKKWACMHSCTPCWKVNTGGMLQESLDRSCHSRSVTPRFCCSADGTESVPMPVTPWRCGVGNCCGRGGKVAAARHPFQGDDGLCF